MFSLTLFLHLTFAGLWLGCVLTETLFERALLGQGRGPELLLADLHKRVDLFIEVPAFLAVFATGMLLYESAHMTPLLLAKLGFGLLAIITNIYCVWLVVRRATAAHQGRWEQFAQLDRRQHQFGAVVLVALLLALALGGYNASNP
ncbi:MAG TPA: hypothetical protein VGE00_02910 [Gammaproteobacteria bacterium]